MQPYVSTIVPLTVGELYASIHRPHHTTSSVNAPHDDDGSSRSAMSSETASQYPAEDVHSQSYVQYGEAIGSESAAQSHASSVHISASVNAQGYRATIGGASKVFDAETDEFVQKLIGICY